MLNDKIKKNQLKNKQSQPGLTNQTLIMRPI
jgi:hypothetical protein